MDTNQAGNTMDSRYITGKYGAIIGTSVLPVGAMIRGGSAVKGSQALKYYGAYKRPVLTLGVYKEIRGATTAMALSKMYSKGMLTASVFGFARNVQLARAREWKRLGINVMGPPGSLFLYDNHMAHDMDAEAEIAQAEQEKSRLDSSLTSESKIRGTKRSTKKFLSGTTPYAYKPKRGERCRKGYKSELIMGRRMCVKID